MGLVAQPGAGRRIVGGVLCGGASRRMGTDKALLELSGVPLATHVADVLRASGAVTVVALGGDPRLLAKTGLTVLEDHVADGGPLAGILRGLEHFDTDSGNDTDTDDTDTVASAGTEDSSAPNQDPGPMSEGYVGVFAACDLPQLSTAVVRLLVAQVTDGAEVAVAEVDGRSQWHLSAVSASAHGGLAQAWRDGARSLGRAFERLEPATVPLRGHLAHLAASVTDVDTPEAWNAIGHRR